MNALIYQADIKTHVKIIAVALIPAILIAAIAIQEHIGF
jgi:hypothetical protein